MSFWTSGLAGSPLDGLLFLGYLDPGTGSYALQMILAGLFGGMFALKQSWASIKLWTSARLARRGVEGPHSSPAKRPAVHGRSTPRA